MEDSQSSAGKVVQEGSGVAQDSCKAVQESSGTVQASSDKVQESSGVGQDGSPGDQKNTGKKKTRSKHKCPFPSCESVVVHLPRHMRTCHDWNEKDSCGVLNIFGLRKQRIKTGKKKREYKSFMCPVKDCRAVVKRIHNHLTEVHKYKRGGKQYKKYLASAKLHEILVIPSSESSSCEETSPSSEDFDMEVKSSSKMKMKKKINPKKKSSKHPSIFEQVYSSEDHSSDNDYNDSCQRIVKGVSPPFESIFKKESETESTSSTSHLTSNDENSEQEKPVTVTKVKEQSRTSSDDSSGENISGFPGEDSPKEDLPDLGGDNSPHLNSVIFQKFSQWLQGPDGGRKDQKCAQQCSRQVQLVVAAINPESPNINNLFDRKTLRDSWLIDFEKKKQPGTVKSYLIALNLFFVYLKCEQPHELASVSPEQLANLSETMKQWGKSCKNLVKDRFWEKRMDDLSKLKTPENVQEFDRSKLARDAVRIIGEHQDALPERIPSHQEYVTVRDYLLTLLCINNGSRSGALANMTLAEYRTAQRDEDDFVVNVKKHKTFTTHGPAHIVMSSTIHKWVSIFITQLRNKLGDVDEVDTAPVFISWNLRPMDSSHIGKQIGSCWGKVFGKDAASGGATSFRKAAVSAMQEHDEEGRDHLASLMVHRKETADRYYLLKKKSKEAVIASRNLRSIMHSKGSKTASNDVAAAARHQWTSEQEETLTSLFASEIDEGNVTLERVKDVTKDHAVLGKFNSAKIYNKIRHMIASAPDDICTAELPQETETVEDRLERIGIRHPPSDARQPTTSSGGKRKHDETSEYTPSMFSATKTSASNATGKLFDVQETELFRTVFHDLIHGNQAVKRAEIMQRIKDNPNLCHLSQRYSPVQLTDKVRTERKILQRQKDI